MKLNIYYKKDAEEVSKVYNDEDVYAEFIRQYHLLKSIKAEFTLSIVSDSEILVKLNYTNNVFMYAINHTSIPHHKAHYIQEYI
jgi:hypothetical protein